MTLHLLITLIAVLAVAVMVALQLTTIQSKRTTKTAKSIYTTPSLRYALCLKLESGRTILLCGKGGGIGTDTSIENIKQNISCFDRPIEQWNWWDLAFYLKHEPMIVCVGKEVDDIQHLFTKKEGGSKLCLAVEVQSPLFEKLNGVVVDSSKLDVVYSINADEVPVKVPDATSAELLLRCSLDSLGDEGKRPVA